MTNNEFKKLIAETVLEEIQKPNSKIAKLMLARERRLDKALHEEDFIDETINVLMEHLHLKREKVISEADKELERMKGLL